MHVTTTHEFCTFRSLFSWVKPFFKDDVQGQLQGARCYDGLTNVDNASIGGQSMRQKTEALEQSTCIVHHCIVSRKRCAAIPTDGTRTCNTVYMACDVCIDMACDV